MAARERAGLTQVEAAQRLGLTQSYVSKIEALYRRVDMLELWKLLGLYEYPLAEFYAPVTPEERRQVARYRRAAWGKAKPRGGRGGSPPK